MNDEERALLKAYLAQLDNILELTEIEETIVEQVSEDENPISLGGEGEKTLWLQDQARAVTVKRRKLVCTSDGLLVNDINLIAGFCAVCKEKEGKLKLVSKMSARRCSVCGRLLCGDHQVLVGGAVYCPAHGRWRRIWKLIFG